MPICHCGDFVKPTDVCCQTCGEKNSPFKERGSRPLPPTPTPELQRKAIQSAYQYESGSRPLPPTPTPEVQRKTINPEDQYESGDFAERDEQIEDAGYMTPVCPDEENDAGYINTMDIDAGSDVEDPYYEDVDKEAFDDSYKLQLNLPTINLTGPAESSESLISQLDDGFKNEIRIVLIGKTGAGKSTTGNILLVKEHFTAATSPVSVTKQCCRGESKIHERKIVVVDTPGLFDTELSTEEIQKEIIRCITMSVPGPHIFLILLQVGRLTTEEISTLDQLFDIFGKNMCRFCMIVFTRVEDLARGGNTIDKYIIDGGPVLSRYIKKCDGRYFALKNPLSQEDQLKESSKLFGKINEVISQNKNAYFTNAFYRDAKDSLNTSLKLSFVNQENNNRKKRIEIETDCDRKINENRRQRLQLDDELNNQNEVKRQLKSKREALLQLDDDETSRDELGKLDIENDEWYIRMSKIKLEKEQSENLYEEIKAEKKHLLEARTDDFKKELEEAAAIAIQEQTKLMEPHFLKILKKQQEIQELKTWFESGAHLSNKQMRKSYTDKEKGLQKQKEELEKKLEKKDRSLKHMMRNSFKLQEDFKRTKMKLCLLM